jgi:hypothetical protein
MPTAWRLSTINCYSGRIGPHLKAPTFCRSHALTGANFACPDSVRADIQAGNPENVRTLVSRGCQNVTRVGGFVEALPFAHHIGANAR